MKKNLVVLSGAGISQESGLKTFRDNDGLWENYSIYDVATPQVFEQNPELVLRFYNERRRQLNHVKPNLAHQLLSELQNDFNVQIITQNVDDLHEKAGSKNVLHLHGELKKMRSVLNENVTFSIESDINLGDLAADGGQLRPHIVWFGEAVPAMSQAIDLTKTADIFVIVGTSMQVYPAASLIDFVPSHASTYYIDPNPLPLNHSNIVHFQQKATSGMEQLIKILS